MFFIDTAAATIRPTQKCLEWANAVAKKMAICRLH